MKIAFVFALFWCFCGIVANGMMMTGKKNKKRRVVRQATNANACVADLRSVGVGCMVAPGQQLPSNLIACCAALKKFAYADSCACSPTINTIMGTGPGGVSNLDLLLGLKPLCASLGAASVIPDSDCTACKTPSGINSGACASFNGKKCGVADWIIENGRFLNAAGFGATVEAFSNNPVCFSYAAFKGALGQFFDADDLSTKTPYADIAYGIGRYTYIEHVLEYVALSQPLISKGILKISIAQAQTPDSVLMFGADGRSIITGNRAMLTWFNNCTSAVGYVESVFGFAGCSVKLNSLTIPDKSRVVKKKSTSLSAMISNLHKLATVNASYVLADICNYHDQYCKGANQQFANMTECLSFLSSLPTVSPKCGLTHPMSGNSRLCRMIHHYMIPFAPQLHCFHIGKGLPDVEGNVRCTDVGNCKKASLGGDASLLKLSPSDADKVCINNGNYAKFPSLC